MKRVPVPSTSVEWKKFAGNFIKANLKIAGMEYKDLQLRLAKMGISQSVNAITLKLNTGAFSAIFLLQVLTAIGVNRIELPLQEDERST
jgi:hypothetical protein